MSRSNTHIFFNLVFSGAMDFQHLLRISGYFTSTFHGVKNWGSRKYYFSLSVCPWIIQSSIHFELDLPIHYWELSWSHCYSCWFCANSPLLWFLLSVYNKRLVISVLGVNWNLDTQLINKYVNSSLSKNWITLNSISSWTHSTFDILGIGFFIRFNGNFSLLEIQRSAFQEV